MAVSRKQLAGAIRHLVKQSTDRHQVAQSVAAYLIDQRRTKDFHGLMRDLEELHYRQDNRLEVTATAARPLSSEAKQKIQQLFAGNEVIIHEDINPNLIGGVRVRALDKVADFSVQARLRQLRAGRS